MSSNDLVLTTFSRRWAKSTRSSSTPPVSAKCVLSLSPSFYTYQLCFLIRQYADPVLDKLDIHNAVAHRLFRESCYSHKGNYVKVLALSLPQKKSFAQILPSFRTSHNSADLSQTQSSSTTPPHHTSSTRTTLYPSPPGSTIHTTQNSSIWFLSSLILHQSTTYARSSTAVFDPTLLLPIHARAIVKRQPVHLLRTNRLPYYWAYQIQRSPIPVTRSPDFSSYLSHI
jgi:hypothetical protein